MVRPTVRVPAFQSKEFQSLLDCVLEDVAVNRECVEPPTERVARRNGAPVSPEKGGIPFHMILSRFFDDASTAKRFAVATLLALGIWIINYYAIIAWAQPLMIGGSWILDQIPIWVAAGTHLVFGWTMLLVDQWGRFTPPVPLSKEREL